MNRDLIGKIRRGLKKPPKVIFQKIISEINAEIDPYIAPRRAGRFDEYALIKAVEASSLDSLWTSLGQRHFPAVTDHSAVPFGICPGDDKRILAMAEDALNHRVNLLGSGPVVLGEKIDWHKDHKTGFSWPLAFFRKIDYNNPERPSDVKFPWEVSRMQWLIPAGQAYLLTRDERYAAAVRAVIVDWIDSNPYACSVNWACTMEVALRILSWTWFFHVFKNSEAWSDRAFRVKYLSALYLHGDFTERHLEFSDVNGNHYTADAAGLVFAGLFWGKGKCPQRWLRLGWDILCDELPKQVFPDGVDYEASVPYHRLVLELFLLPALYREAYDLDVPAFYRERVIKMTQFTSAYSRPNGSVPLFGDADDARALPFGGQEINDHRYLMGIVGAAWDVRELKDCFSGPRSEIFWLLGKDASDSLTSKDRPVSQPISQAFAQGGFYIMRNDTDHVFIDCGPVGLAGRGGHGHNDCLSLEVCLKGVHIVSDCGAFLYTASYKERNNFRSTAYHNTPQVDGEEINRFIGRDYLWTLKNDAAPKVLQWQTNAGKDIFCGSHSGYERLAAPVLPVRTIILDHALHSIIIRDEIISRGEHLVTIPLHLAPEIEVEQVSRRLIRLRESKGQCFILTWDSEGDWNLGIEEGYISASYGVRVPTKRLLWRRKGSWEPSFALSLSIVPEVATPAVPRGWMKNLLRELKKSD